MGKLLKIVGVIAVLLIVPKIVSNVMGMDEKSQTKKQMMKLVSDVSSNLPKEVGPGVTLTGVEFENNVFRNNYTLEEAAHFDLSQKAKYETNALELVCLGAIKEFSKKGVIFEYRYKYTDTGGVKTFDIAVPPSDCS